MDNTGKFRVLRMLDAIRLDDTLVSSSNLVPTLDGTIAANEYGVFIQTVAINKVVLLVPWYMSSDATNLYIGISGANTAEGAVLYLDKTQLLHGGTNTDGNLVGYNYDGSSFMNLQFWS